MEITNKPKIKGLREVGTIIYCLGVLGGLLRTFLSLDPATSNASTTAVTIALVLGSAITAVEDTLRIKGYGVPDNVSVLGTAVGWFLAGTLILLTNTLSIFNSIAVWICFLGMFYSLIMHRNVVLIELSLQLEGNGKNVNKGRD